MSVNIWAPTFDACDSYGRLAGELAGGLEARGMKVNRLDADAHVLSKTHRIHPPQMTPALGGLLLGYPTNFHKFGWMANTGPRIAVTMFESTRLPEGWADALNRCDAVVVPARFLVHIFREAGVTVPVHVVPLGISGAFRGYHERGTGSDPFTVLAIADRGWRKGWLKAIAAFCKAFEGRPNFRLILKARKMPVDVQIENVLVIEGDYSDEEMAELYRRAHVMLFPSAGEGFGLPPREFAATGGLALATNWGGTADDIVHWGMPIPYSLTTAWLDNPAWYGKLGQWADVSEDALSALLVHVWENYPAYAAVRRAGSVYVQEHYTWQGFADGVLRVWDDVLVRRKEKQHASVE